VTTAAPWTYFNVSQSPRSALRFRLQIDLATSTCQRVYLAVRGGLIPTTISVIDEESEAADGVLWYEKSWCNDSPIDWVVGVNLNCAGVNQMTNFSLFVQQGTPVTFSRPHRNNLTKLFGYVRFSIC
jgi:hypothetical protein